MNEEALAHWGAVAPKTNETQAMLFSGILLSKGQYIHYSGTQHIASSGKKVIQ